MVGYTEQSAQLKIENNDFEIIREILAKVKHPAQVDALSRGAVHIYALHSLLHMEFRKRAHSLGAYLSLPVIAGIERRNDSLISMQRRSGRMR